MAAELPELEPVFGEAKLELASESASCRESNPSADFLLLYVSAPDSSHLKIQVTDFRSRTWEAVRSTSQLEDMRDNIGIGGSWSDFIDYLMASIKSQDVKISLKTHDSGIAMLVAQKSKGMPRISFSLNKIAASAATDANAFLSMELFKAFKRLQCLCSSAQDQECSKPVSSQHGHQVEELCSKRQKPEKANFSASLMTDDGQNSPAKAAQAARDRGPTKGANRVVSAYRRAKVRGVVLQDDDDDDDDDGDDDKDN